MNASKFLAAGFHAVIDDEPSTSESRLPTRVLTLRPRSLGVPPWHADSWDRFGRLSTEFDRAGKPIDSLGTGIFAVRKGGTFRTPLSVLGQELSPSTCGEIPTTFRALRTLSAIASRYICTTSRLFTDLLRHSSKAALSVTITRETALLLSGAARRSGESGSAVRIQHCTRPRSASRQSATERSLGVRRTSSLGLAEPSTLRGGVRGRRRHLFM